MPCRVGKVICISLSIGMCPTALTIALDVTQDHAQKRVDHTSVESVFPVRHSFQLRLSALFLEGLIAPQSGGYSAQGERGVRKLATSNEQRATTTTTTTTTVATRNVKYNCRYAEHQIQLSLRGTSTTTVAARHVKYNCRYAGKHST